MTDRRLLSALVAATVAKVKASAGSGVIPRLVSGTVTDAGTRPTVVLDVIPTPPPQQMNCAGDAPGPGERVWVLQAFGTGLVVGRRGGAQRLLGYATDTADDPFTTSEVLGGLTFNVVVNQPGRVIVIEGAGQILTDTNGTIVVGELWWDGAPAGRWFRHEFPTLNVAEFGAGFAYVLDPAPGVYTVEMRGTATGGTGTFKGTTTPGFLMCRDAGPVGGMMP